MSPLMMSTLTGLKRFFATQAGRLTLGIGVVALIGLSINALLSASPHLELSGLLQAKEINNASRFGGRVKTVWVKEGQWVEAGQKLVTFEDIEIRSKIAEARASLTQAKARESLLAGGADAEDLQQAQSQVKQAEQSLRILQKGALPEELAQAQARVVEAKGRYEAAQRTFSQAKAMLDDGIISQHKYDDLQNQLNATHSQLQASQSQLKQLQAGNRPEQIRIAKAQLQGVKAQYTKLAKGTKPGEIQIGQAAVDQAESMLKALEAQLTESEVVAPISGVITILNVDPGELVAPSKPIVSIIDYKNLWTDIYVPENALQSVKTGQIVQITSPVYPGKHFQGRVAFVSPKSEFIPNNSSNNNPDEQSSFRVKVEVQYLDEAKQAQLHPGMKIHVQF